MEFSSEQSITALVDRLAGDGDPKGAKEAWKTSCVLGLQHWKEEKVLIVPTPANFICHTLHRFATVFGLFVMYILAGAGLAGQYFVCAIHCDADA